MSPRELAEALVFWAQEYREGNVDLAEFLEKARDVVHDFDLSIEDESDELDDDSYE